MIDAHPISLRMSCTRLSGSDEIYLTKSHINKVNNAEKYHRGDTKISQKQICKLKQMAQTA